VASAESAGSFIVRARSVVNPEKSGTATVTPVKSVAGITITAQPSKTVYVAGEDLDLAGLAVTAAFTDNTTRALVPADLAVSGYDKTAPGTQTVTLIYGGKTAAFTVTVMARQYAVSFESNGGSPVTAQTVTEGEKAARPANPTRTGYTFADWYGDAAFATAYDFNAPVTADKTLYARWTVNTYGQTVILTLSDFTDPASSLLEGAAVTLVRPGGTETLTVTEGTNVTWYLGLAKIGTGNNVTLYADSLSLGRHTLRVTAEYDGKPYSKEIALTVAE
jgi:uncharacterized repeat protein (TIGR02543 family)